ncbi:STAS domain-containing protein [Streptomyces sp. 7R007]
MTSAAHTSRAGRLNTLVIEAQLADGQALLMPRGELVHGCAHTLSRTLTQLPVEPDRVELDMSGVVFMDTAGLQFLDLLQAYGDLHRVPVRTRNWNGQPRRILELAGLDADAPLRSPVRHPAPEPGSPPRSAVARERAEQLRLLQEEVEQLRHAIVSRPVIDQARGVLMATQSCTSDEAWNILREASQLSNTKLRTVAAAVTAVTETNAPPPPPEVRSALRRAITHCLH